MSISLRMANLYDYLALGGFTSNLAFDRISLTPVFHVEKLFINDFYDEIRSFLRQFCELAGARAVVTCITPLSPILSTQLRQERFDVEEYWERMRQLGRHAIVGLHGHFLRASSNGRILPMHFSYYDNEIIEKQLAAELEELKARGLVDEELLIYSGGWWFTSPELRALLMNLGFRWDYTISRSPFNISPGIRACRTSIVDGILQEAIDGKVLKSAVAVSGISRQGRPYQSIGRVLRESRNYPAGPIVLSLYSHDYDLDSDSALVMTQRYLQAGLKFSEPG